jgi:hypothetical protein
MIYSFLTQSGNIVTHHLAFQVGDELSQYL